MKNIAFILAICGLLYIPQVSADESLTFYGAQKASKKINAKTSTTFLCGCSINDDDKINLDTCGYVPKNEETVEGRLNHRAFRSELDHAVSAAELGSGLQCWGRDRDQYKQCFEKDGDLVSGRSCCLRVDSRFKNAHNDMVNLIPIIGEVNADKLDKVAFEVPNGGRSYGMCDVEVTNSTWEPPTYRKGDIARITLYMHKKYGRQLNMQLSDDRYKLYQQWSQADPVDREEATRNKDICYEQGFGNPLVSNCN